MKMNVRSPLERGISQTWLIIPTDDMSPSKQLFQEYMDQLLMSKSCSNDIEAEIDFVNSQSPNNSDTSLSPRMLILDVHPQHIPCSTKPFFCENSAQLTVAQKLKPQNMLYLIQNGIWSPSWSPSTMSLIFYVDQSFWPQQCVTYLYVAHHEYINNM